MQLQLSYTNYCSINKPPPPKPNIHMQHSLNAAVLKSCPVLLHHIYILRQ